MNTFNDKSVYLFINGVVDRGFGNIIAGGVLQNQNGNGILGYNHYLGKCSTFEAELWGVLDGILILRSKGFTKAMIHIDNLEVARALHDGMLVDADITMLKRVQRIMRTDGQWSIRYILGENNLVADTLVKLSLEWESRLQIYDKAPNEVLDVLNKEQASGAFVSLV
ncbi:hypothetical protein PVK06_038192 [Gossypium arboreum]|uniref:RNase H type-1 domain-containing protein n=1 Tax=Gossypium arboreum TaxID=29729 RepID=A0ABR0MZG5_GOSAR|nr:hypothetical protein PVK06_038192 [Gossypium arboreum]